MGVILLILKALEVKPITINDIQTISKCVNRWIVLGLLLDILENIADSIKLKIREYNRDEIKLVAIWLINGWEDEKSDTNNGYELTISTIPNKARNKNIFLNKFILKDPLLHFATEEATA